MKTKKSWSPFVKLMAPNVHQPTTMIDNAHYKTLIMISQPTKKYSVHKEQKDIREKTTDDLKENWVNQKYNRKLHEYFTNKLLSEDFNKCVKKLKKQTLRKYAKDEIEDIDNERKKWVKDREEESLKEITNSENILIPYGMQFENPEINDLATQLQGIALNVHR
ncbi:hypothetical protein C2G38_2039679 [Gigaspora rosea]|uniref:Uncharacterized protein n=1 Tax=Gigaspora rosea TaxID=44941 RepID=A0A397UZB1_9GLOM|nr:hypothetical protein C2G38_2039679 [Gigaspora rosea]